MRRLIKTDGTVADFPNRVEWSEIRRLCAVKGFDIVRLRHLGEPLHVMLIDDDGWESEMIDHGNGQFELRPIRARKPINHAATTLYHANCIPGTKHSIAGDVFICPDADFPPDTE